MTKNKTRLLFILIGMQFISTFLHAETDSVHQNKTRDEKRETIEKHDMTDWLSVSAIAEIEHIHQRNTRLNNSENSHSNTDDFSKSLDLEIVIEPDVDSKIEILEHLSSEIVIEYDDEKKKFLIDEAVVILELGETEIELGKLYVPFGEYFSRFVTGSSLEFAETRAKGVLLSHAPTLSENFPLEDLDLSLYAYQGKARQENSGSHAIDWGISTEFRPQESWMIGLGYLSDLADADAISLEDSNNRYAKRIGGFGIYSTFGFSTEKLSGFELTTEYISALDDFKEFEIDRNKPEAWNIELAHFPTGQFEWAVRYAGSKELEDEPNRQWGVASTWHINKRANITLEYLHNDYKHGLVEDDQEEPLDTSKHVGGRLSVLF